MPIAIIISVLALISISLNAQSPRTLDKWSERPNRLSFYVGATTAVAQDAEVENLSESWDESDVEFYRNLYRNAPVVAVFLAFLNSGSALSTEELRSPYFGIDYRRTLSRRLDVYGRAGYGSNTMITTHRKTGATLHSVKYNRLSTGLGGKFNYLRKKSTALYSGFGITFEQYLISSIISDPDGILESGQARSSDLNTIAIRPNITILGIEQLLGQHLTLGAEIGFGGTSWLGVHLGGRF